MTSVKDIFFIVVSLLTLFSMSLGAPDSAGIVEMIDGLAYAEVAWNFNSRYLGGIPYGSVSGMLSKYHGPPDRINSPASTGQILPHLSNQYQQTRSPTIVTPNLRAPGVARRARGPVQIYRLPAVIAPGVIGTINQIGY